MRRRRYASPLDGQARGHVSVYGHIEPEPDRADHHPAARSYSNNHAPTERAIMRRRTWPPVSPSPARSGLQHPARTRPHAEDDRPSGARRPRSRASQCRSGDDTPAPAPHQRAGCAPPGKRAAPGHEHQAGVPASHPARARPWDQVNSETRRFGVVRRTRVEPSRRRPRQRVAQTRLAPHRDPTRPPAQAPLHTHTRRQPRPGQAAPMTCSSLLLPYVPTSGHESVHPRPVAGTPRLGLPARDG